MVGWIGRWEEERGGRGTGGGGGGGGRVWFSLGLKCVLIWFPSSFGRILVEKDGFPKVLKGFREGGGARDTAQTACKKLCFESF